MSDYKGTIIEESLEDKTILRRAKVLSVAVEKVTDEHRTPWVTQWTLDTVEIPEGEIATFTEALSVSLDSKHPWYADLKNERFHYIVFRNKVFKVSLEDSDSYENARSYGISIGIPGYQVDFK